MHQNLILIIKAPILGYFRGLSLQVFRASGLEVL